MEFGILIGASLATIFYINARAAFKISYYEAKLKNRGVDINRVKNMAWWKLWLN